MLLRFRNIHVALAITFIVAVGLVVGWASYRREGRKIMSGLVTDALHSAAGFDEGELAQFKGTREDVRTEAYARVKARLRRFHNADPRIKFIYIFRQLPAQKKIIFLADSADPGASDESLPGDVYPEAANSPGLQSIIHDGQPSTEGPLQDSFGTWVTGYALIGAVPAPGAPRDILGVDLAATEWTGRLWTNAAGTAVIVWIVLGLPLAWLVVMRRQLEQREAIRNLSEAMEQSHSAVMIVDLDSCIEYVNSGLCRQMGYTRRDLIGRNWRDFQSAETPAEFIATLVTTVRSGQPWQGEWLYRRKDGSSYPVRGAVSPVKRRDGEITCFVAVFEDMTEIKRTEAMLRVAKEQAEAGDRAKGYFLAIMSHEVRTPLNGIVGFTSLLLETQLTPDQLEYVDTIRTSSETLIQLTGDILDYARIESGKLKLEPQPCHVRECVEDALDLIAGKISGRNLELLHWVEDTVPAVVTADGGRLRQVLVNLINNAAKFTPQGEIEVSVQAEPAPADLNFAGGWLLTFAVRDTGIGIAPEDHGRLFKPFTQLDGTATRRYGGTGLGLAISKNIVELMGGGISFTSEQGVGTIFTFTIRAERAEAPGDSTVIPLRATPMRLAIAAPAGALRAELARVGERSGAQVIETTPEELAAVPEWDLAVMAVDDLLASELAIMAEPRAGLPPEKIIGIVPLSFPTARRNALRPHFRLLISKPVHHESLRALLAGVPGAAAPVADEAALNLRVLLVEDNRINQRLMQKILTNLGCTWALADHGRAALEQIAAGPFDVVLMDLHMPEMDGITAIKKIRAGEAGDAMRGCWIIALTADARAEQRTLAMEAGANDYLTKPVKLPDFSAALQRFNASRQPGTSPS
ncbi:MAG: response regulator [Verrucomicrobia bacterium]|nr:response regulator [Verrucomicrobiota bacterium]